MFSAIAFAIFGVFVIGLIVFGGGQVFIPLFQSLWNLLSTNFNLNFNNDLYQNIFTVVNSTPGVVSTKLAAITGLIVAQGEWWGFLILFITYLVFVIPAILLMYYANIFYKKIVNKYLKTTIVVFKPIIIGILLALVMQLFFSVMFFQLNFNYSLQEYISFTPNSLKSTFFSDWRLYALYVWFPIEIIISIYLYRKKINLFFIIVLMIVLSLIVFEPWLN